MRTFAIVFFLTLLVCGACLVGPGCSLFPPDDCASHLRCPGVANDATVPGDAADAMLLAESAVADVDGNDGATSEGGDGGLDATNLPDVGGCDPTKSPHDAPCVVDQGGAVFVAPGASGGSDTTGHGTRSAPFATIGYALAHLGGRDRLYICDATYPESLSMTVAANVYGGLSCPNGDAGWNYVGGTAQVHGAQNQVPLTIDGVARAISIEDMAIVAASASGQDDAGNGRSSIAALVNASTVVFRRCSLTAGSGDRGSNGGTTSNYGVATAPEGGANNGADGGAGGAMLCNDGTSSTGGTGGSATMTTADDGGNGTANPMPETYPVMALDGLGGTGGYGCSGGHKGAYSGASDGGVAAMTHGLLTASGWTPSAGGNGYAGQPGQGGGGGGGIAGAVSVGGTGGGAGGCGGAGGTGGGGGGASVALACIGSAVTLERCTLTTSAAGNGGKGGDGQLGQGGGASPASVAACSGGIGGNGAGGGGGAGGTGGVAVCIVCKGNAPTGVPSCAAGPAGLPGGHGQGGAGGTNALNSAAPDGGPGADGLPGISDAALQVP